MLKTLPVTISVQTYSFLFAYYFSMYVSDFQVTFALIKMSCSFP